MVALAMGIALAELFLPVFNDLARKNLSIPYLDSWGTMVALKGIVGIAGLVAGSYPAAVLLRIQPVEVLKGQKGIGGRNLGSRVLMVVQYGLTITLMISAAMMFQQLRYVKEKDLGYREEQVVVVPAMVRNADTVSNRYKAEISRSPWILNATISDRAFTTGANTKRLESESGERVQARIVQIDHDYLETLKIQLIAGRNFTPASSSLKSYALVNEKLAGMLGWEDPVGKTLKQEAWEQLGELTFIGVVKDFHFDSLRGEIKPLLLHTGPRSWGPFVMIRIQPEDIAGSIAFLKETWEVVVPESPFLYSFLEDNLARQYRNEDRWFRITGYTFLFAILISCLGLLGLASLSVTRRTREVGIRKALGGSVPRLVLLLSGEFAKLVLVANLLAWPVAYYVTNRWLQNFAYRIDPEPEIFIFCGALALGTAMLAVGVQSVKAALANPVDALRYE